jgi:hypothetical protein
MDDVFRILGFKGEGPIDKVECGKCGALMEIPLYCNVGRFVPMPVWCWKCGQLYKYWNFFGCHKFPETEGWNLPKVVSYRTNGKVIEKE